MTARANTFRLSVITFSRGAGRLRNGGKRRYYYVVHSFIVIHATWNLDQWPTPLPWPIARLSRHCTLWGQLIIHLAPTTTMENSNPLLLTTQARCFASHAFSSHVHSVLRHVTVTCLRRLLTERVRNYMRHHVSQDELLNSTISIEEILSQTTKNSNFVSTNLLNISNEDVQYCYTMAMRVGKKWAQVLQRQGYVDLAELTLSIVEKGNFLEPKSSSGAATATITTGNNNIDSHPILNRRRNDFVSPYTALHALRRYPNECNSSGIPLQYLPAVYDDNDNSDAKSKGVSQSSNSARKLIEQIDTMVQNEMSYWHYGWDAIEEAVQRNRARIDYSRTGGHTNTAVTSDVSTVVNNGVDEVDEVALVPPIEVVDEGGHGIVHGRVSTSSRKRGRLETETSTTNNNVNDDVATEERDNNDNYNVNNIRKQLKRGRPPSSIGTEVYHRDDILNELTLQERKQIIESSIHPPFPYESDMVDDNDDCETSGADDPSVHPPQHHHAVICGALKDVGQIHLWEQTRHVSASVRLLDGNETASTKKDDRMTNQTQPIFGASEAQSVFQSERFKQLQKRASTRALKERLGRRIVPNAEYRAENAQHATCSKVRWTEEGEITHHQGENRSEERTTDQWEHSESRNKWLEMDLGECMMEVVDDTEQTTLESAGNIDNEEKKVLLGFRSLEMALKM